MRNSSKIFYARDTHLSFHTAWAHRDANHCQLSCRRLGDKRTSARLVETTRMTDAVEKGFLSSDRARLIQDQAPARSVESQNHSSRFDCCVLLFPSFHTV